MFSSFRGTGVFISTKTVVKNIVSGKVRELGLSENDVHYDRGCLRTWSVQKVLLINSILSLLEGKSKSHKETAKMKGWQTITKKKMKHK